jgi:NAD(P)-dependent dehydrogenase (short-subunit alcohol dehydrogenase family)
MHMLFDTPYRALVIGASGAIGQAFSAALQADPLCRHVHTVSRTSHSGFDLQDPASLGLVAQACTSAGPFHFIVDATGALMLGSQGPEKSLAALDAQHLAHALQINAIGPVLLLKHLSPLLAPGPSIYAKLSARVGSISDNRKGGWYGYRAAKAALNMLLQTAAIELQRKNPQLRVAALQPGTVRSQLSQPFTSTASVLLEPADSVAGLLNALKHLPTVAGAQFVDYRGDVIPW